jgi:hypothetical protein
VARSRALVELARWLNPAGRDAALGEAVEAAWAVKRQWGQSEIFADLAPQLAELGQPARALEAARVVEDPAARSRALADRAPRLDAAGRDAALREAIEAARAVEGGLARSRALAELAPKLATLLPSRLAPLWEELLRGSVTRPRSTLLTDLVLFNPILAILGGAESMTELALAIRDVRRWWP